MNPNQDYINNEIQNAIDWYYRQGKRYYYRLFYKIPGQAPILRAVMDELLTGNKEASAEKLRQELTYLASRGEFPIYIRVGGSSNDANPSEMPVFTKMNPQNALVPAGMNSISGIGNAYQQAGIYGPEHIGLIVDNERLKHEIDLIKYQHENSNSAFWVELANSELGKNLISGIMGIVQAFSMRGNPASLAGFSNQQQHTEHNEQIQQQQTNNTTQQMDEETLTMDELYNNYIAPLETNLAQIKSGMTVVDLLSKLVKLSSDAKNGDSLASFKIKTALNNL